MFLPEAAGAAARCRAAGRRGGNARTSPVPRITFASAAALAVIPLLLGACDRRPLMSEVSIAPSEITPDRDGVEDVARIAYSVGRPARVTITLAGPDGADERHTLRDARAREPGIAYQALFGGVIDGRMLADGEYQVTIEARAIDDDGKEPIESVVETRSLIIRDADATVPTMEGFAVHPQVFSPNQDGINDRVSISYRLDEPADVRIWLETAGGDYVTDILAEQTAADRPGEPGPHVIDYDAGVDADAPPPLDGEYVVVAEARDAVGNVARHEAPLSIQNSGLPSVSLVGDVEWSKTLVALGETIVFTATARNTGNTPIRTRGPEPGMVYDSVSTYNLPAPEEWLVVFRRPGEPLQAARLPFDALPAVIEFRSAGQPVVSSSEVGELNDAGDGPPDLCITGEGEGAPRGDAGDGDEVYLFESDGDNGRLVEADEAGRLCVASLPATPAIRRTFARSPGSIRLGLAFDMLESSLEYPFRWQVGSIEDLDVCAAETGAYLCLPPDREVSIHGGVRLVEAAYGHVGNAHLALLHEDVERMHGPYGVRLVTFDFDPPSDP